MSLLKGEISFKKKNCIEKDCTLEVKSAQSLANVTTLYLQGSFFF